VISKQKRKSARLYGRKKKGAARKNYRKEREVKTFGLLLERGRREKGVPVALLFSVTNNRRNGSGHI